MNIKDHASRMPWVLWGIAAAVTAATLPYLVTGVSGEIAAGALSDGAKVLLVIHMVFPAVGLVLLVPALRSPGPDGLGWLVAGVLSGMMLFGSLFPTAVLGAGLIGMRNRRPLHVVGITAAVGAGLAWFVTPIPEDRDDWFALVPLMIGLCSATLLGMLQRGQQELADARVAQSRAEERARISREMHDSLAHRLSLISLHAAALGNRTDLAPEVVATTAATIHTMTAEAGRELRQILQVLHDDDSGAAPVVTWRDVTAVLQRENDGGLQVEAEVAPGWLPAFEAADARTRHAVLRSVEELLGNARQHGDGHAALSFEVTASELVLTCANRVGGVRRVLPGHGLGLPGLEERLRLLGGRFEAGATEGWFRARAEFPTREVEHG